MNARYSLLIAAFCILLASCGDEKKSPVAVLAKKTPQVMQPFRFHKAVEVSPGQTYDVLSWGRGSDSVGAFMVLHSDSSGKEYTATTGDLDGAITDVYNADMDLDGNPEILIQAKAKDTVNYARIYAFEFNNNNANKLDFPRLTSSQRKGYRGDDNFYIKEGKLIREFPIYDGNDKTAKQTGAKRQLEYSLRSNSFTVQQLSKDSTAVKSSSNDAKPVVRQVESEKKQTVSKRSTKKNKTESRSKRRRRRG